MLTVVRVPVRGLELVLVLDCSLMRVDAAVVAAVVVGCSSVCDWCDGVDRSSALLTRLLLALVTSLPPATGDDDSNDDE